MSKNCNLCLATTTRNKLCKRKATCRLGCNNFCYQHAKMYSGKHKPRKKCVENLSMCKSCKFKTQDFPCKKKRTVFMNYEDFEEWCEMVRARKRVKR